MLDQKGMTRASLVDEMGGRSRVSQFFRGDRKLSLKQIVRLHELLNIPVELLAEKPRRVVTRRTSG
ncbi:MAG: helix-turn-helix domain-containing protein [Gemmatimonadaceae bacterium]